MPPRRRRVRRSFIYQQRSTKQLDRSISKRSSAGTDAKGRIDLEQLSKLIAGTVLFLYINGLLGVNGYLLRLGISDFSLVRSRFIYTGTVICFSFILSFGWLMATFVNYRKRMRKLSGERRRQFAMTFEYVFFFGPFPIVILACLLSLSHPGGFSSGPLEAVRDGAGTAIILAVGRPLYRSGTLSSSIYCETRPMVS